MSLFKLQAATKAPTGWRVALVCNPARPAQISIHREISRVTETHCLVSIEHARMLADEMRNALRATGARGKRTGEFRQLYSKQMGDWHIAAYQQIGRQPYLHAHHCVTDRDGDSVTVENQISRADAWLICEAIDELLEAHQADAPSVLEEGEARLAIPLSLSVSDPTWVPEWARIREAA